MDLVYSTLGRINTENKRELLTLMLGVIAVCTVPFVICALVVSDTADAGFNVVFTALLNACFCGGGYYVVKNSKTPLAVGSPSWFVVDMIWACICVCLDRICHGSRNHVIYTQPDDGYILGQIQLLQRIWS
jgi:hypothetical protein